MGGAIKNNKFADLFSKAKDINLGSLFEGFSPSAGLPDNSRFYEAQEEQMGALKKQQEDITTLLSQQQQRVEDQFTSLSDIISGQRKKIAKGKDISEFRGRVAEKQKGKLEKIAKQDRPTVLTSRAGVGSAKNQQKSLLGV